MVPDEDFPPLPPLPETPVAEIEEAPKPRQKAQRKKRAGRPPKMLSEQLAKARAAKAEIAAAARRVREQEEELRTAGLMDAALPEADVLKETPADVKARLTREEKDKISLAEALAREAEIDASDDGSRHGSGNEFDFDKSIIPAGWHYEWKRDTCLNERSPAYFQALARSGWRAVPRDRHPEMMPPDWPGETIMRGGLILMQIPRNTVERYRAEDLQRARSEVENKLAQLSGRSFKGKPGFERTGRQSRDFGPILQSNNEQIYQGHLVEGHVRPGGRTIAR